MNDNEAALQAMTEIQAMRTEALRKTNDRTKTSVSWAQRRFGDVELRCYASWVSRNKVPDWYRRIEWRHAKTLGRWKVISAAQAQVMVRRYLEGLPTQP